MDNFSSEESQDASESADEQVQDDASDVQTENTGAAAKSEGGRRLTVFYQETRCMFKYRRQKAKQVRRGTRRDSIRFKYKKNVIPAGQYRFPFTIKLPERSSEGKYWPSSSTFAKGEDQFRIVWRLQLAFNRNFHETPLELTRTLQLVFQPPADEIGELDRRMKVKVPECETVSQVYVKFQ